MCKENLNSIQGRLLVQTSPSQAYNTDQTVAHAKLYDQEFKQRGISRDRFCIKIPATGPGVIAMKRLVQEGIPVLGTAVFNLEQAVACSQAGCMSVSPYYNGWVLSEKEAELMLTVWADVASFQDPSLWPNVNDPATQHTFSNRLYQMVDAFKRLSELTGKDQPLIKLAAYVTFSRAHLTTSFDADELHRFKTLKEVNAAAELGCHSVTLSPQLLEELSKTPYDRGQDLGSHHAKPQPTAFYSQLPATSTRLQPLLQTDPLKKSNDIFEPVKIEVDYLANNAAELVRALDSDPAGKRRLDDALAMFIQAEQASKTLIESLISSNHL